MTVHQRIIQLQNKFELLLHLRECVEIGAEPFMFIWDAGADNAVDKDNAQ